MTDEHTIPMTKERLRGLPLAGAVWDRALRLEAWKP